MSSLKVEPGGRRKRRHKKGTEEKRPPVLSQKARHGKGRREEKRGPYKKLVYTRELRKGEGTELTTDLTLGVLVVGVLLLGWCWFLRVLGTSEEWRLEWWKHWDGGL